MTSDATPDGATELARPEKDFGRRLRALRQQKSWTLAEAARRTGLATSTLSKVENGQTSLGYDSLLKLADGFKVDISMLLSGEPTSQPNGRRVVTRRSDGRIVVTDNYEYEYLGSELARKRMVTLRTEVKTESIEEFGPLQRHPGEEFVWVDAGRIIVFTEFYEPVELGPGDSLYFDSMMGHAFIRVGKERAFILNVISAPPVSKGTLRGVGDVEQPHTLS